MASTKQKGGCLGTTILTMMLSAFVIMGFRTTFQRHFWKPFWKEHPVVDRWVKKEFKGLRKVTGRTLLSVRKILQDRRRHLQKTHSPTFWKTVNRIWELWKKEMNRSLQKKVQQSGKTTGTRRSHSKRNAPTKPPYKKSLTPLTELFDKAKIPRWLREAKDSFWKDREYERSLRLLLFLQKHRRNLTLQQKLDVDRGLGWCYLEVVTQPLASAKRQFLKVLKHRPGDESARFGLVLVFLRMKKEKRGIQGLKSYLRQFPSGLFHKEAGRILRTYQVLSQKNSP